MHGNGTHTKDAPGAHMYGNSIHMKGVLDLTYREKGESDHMN